MSGTSVISKVFWPAHACTPRMRPGFIIGWNVRSFTACVAAVVSDVELSDLEAALSTFAADTHTAFAQMSKVCAVPPIVLGVFTGRGGKRAGGKAGVPEMFKSEAVTEKKQSANLWITIEMLDNYMPSLSSIYCCGFHYPHVPTEIIFYHQPNPTHLQYLSLEPLVLDVSPDVQPAEKPPQQGGQQQQQANERDVTTLRNMQRVMSHSRKVTGGGGGKEDAGDMEIVLNQINTSYYLEKGVSALLRRARRQRRRPFSDVLFDFLSALLGRLLLWCARVLWSPLLRPALVHPIMLVLFVVRFVAEVALFLLNVRLPKWAMNGVAIKDLSTAAQQVDLRLQQACYWPWQYMLLRRRNWANMATTRAQYISMWLVANDIIIGVAVGSFLINNSTYVAASLHYYLDHYMVDSLESMIDWLMGWPAGLKLNSELDKFLGELFLWLIRMWTVCMASLRPITPTLIGLIGLSGVCGASMIFSLASDLIAFMTLHVYWFYMVAARIFNWQLTILFSLFNLFQGKKRNMLRHRIDSCDYDLDQLLLGTILFTLLTFLFPTIIVYYLTFATVKPCWCYFPPSPNGDTARLPESLSSVCHYAAIQGPREAAWYVRA
ncbi:N-acetylglucosaminyl transferase component-domain-containing protein [Endogone sp. FLAS-F59071]|nr:N-acetylglucosaminyl transferase component-domain-containing protein [Endogone sp. FLAS-F59071]|eukprot:RUS15753.1 N-acetylglucosaminyl transferase component-domain-containing protein [Endogone sp. FLAS-F59071]